MTVEMEFDRWCHDLHNICGHYDGVARRHQRRVRGGVRARQFDGLDIADVGGDVAAIHRDRRGIRRDEAEHIFCIIQAEGAMRVDHNDVRSVIDAGDCMLLDSTKEGTLGFEGQGRLLSLHMPRDTFLAACRSTVRIGHKLPATHPLAPAIRQQIYRLAAGRDATVEVGRANSGLLLDMIALAFAQPGAFSGADEDSPRDRRFALAIEIIDRNLTCDLLSLGWLAHQVGMSTRQIQRLFEAEETSFAREVRDRRLTLAASALRKARTDGRARISDIAFDSGFRDLSNFNRGFKSRFGMAPRDYLGAGDAIAAVRHSRP